MDVKKIVLSVLTLSAAVPVLIWVTSDCGEVPIYPRATRWERIAVYPINEFIAAELAEGNDGKVYAAGWSSGGPGVGLIYVYDGEKVEESYRGGDAFRDIGFYDGTVWAVGNKWEQSGSRYRPYVVRLRGDQWEEFAVPDEVDEGGFAKFFPTATDTCWFAGDRNVYTYSNGNWARVFETRESCDFGVSSGNQAYYYHFDRNNGTACILTSADSGASWVREEVDLGRGVYHITNEYSGARLAAGGEKLYLGMYLSPYEESEKRKADYYHAIIAREPAPPGEGVYEIAFLACDGEAHVNGIWCSGFRSATEGYACGYETAVALQGGVWYPEIVGPLGDWRREFTDIAVGPSGFWAIVIERLNYPAYRNFWLYRAYS